MAARETGKVGQTGVTQTYKLLFPPSFPGSPLAAAEGTGGAGGSAICQSQSGSSTRGATWSGKRDRVIN